MGKQVIGKIAASMGLVLTMIFIVPPARAQEDTALSVRAGLLPVVEELPLVLAAKEAAMPLHQIKISLELFRSATALEAALKTGMVDVAGIPLIQATRMIVRGVPLKIVLLLHRGGSGVVLPAGLSEKGLRNALIGIPGNDAGQLLALAAIVEPYGLKLGIDVRYIGIPLHRANNLLATKRISGFLLPEPYGQMAVREGLSTEVFAAKNFLPDMIDLVAVVRQDLIEKNPRAIKELVESLHASGRFIEVDRKKTGGSQAALHQKDVLGFDVDLFAQALGTDQSMIRFDQLAVEEKEVSALLKRALAMEMLEKSVKAETIVAKLGD
ncbi:MAG: ABC transporter substrate-binding protein [Candidatus Omnitrophica bacterium]|nr:ABC transporter substrate-binding protein [Candidatus Omnitrophota bacterium]